MEVLPGYGRDNVGALELVKQSEENTEMEVEEAIGHGAYGDGATGRRLPRRVTPS